ncbi:hypothetical protein, partial [Candidatus Thiosymbion oneisti]|uniref:hypothetical protein n=1 Tax=Candidatus Thiosymbion oneisti TaxID=589554 RepID=UPI001C401922
DSGNPCRNDEGGVGRLQHLEFIHYLYSIGYFRDFAAFFARNLSKHKLKSMFEGMKVGRCRFAMRLEYSARFFRISSRHVAKSILLSSKPAIG